MALSDTKIHFECKCGQSLKMKDGSLGKSVICPGCGKRLVVSAQFGKATVRMAGAMPVATKIGLLSAVVVLLAGSVLFFR